MHEYYIVRTLHITVFTYSNLNCSYTTNFATILLSHCTSISNLFSSHVRPLVASTTSEPEIASTTTPAPQPETEEPGQEASTEASEESEKAESEAPVETPTVPVPEAESDGVKAEPEAKSEAEGLKKHDFFCIYLCLYYSAHHAYHIICFYTKEMSFLPRRTGERGRV